MFSRGRGAAFCSLRFEIEDGDLGILTVYLKEESHTGAPEVDGMREQWRVNGVYLIQLQTPFSPGAPFPFPSTPPQFPAWRARYDCSQGHGRLRDDQTGKGTSSAGAVELSLSVSQHKRLCIYLISSLFVSPLGGSVASLHLFCRGDGPSLTSGYCTSPRREGRKYWHRESVEENWKMNQRPNR